MVLRIVEKQRANPPQGVCDRNTPGRQLSPPTTYKTKNRPNHKRDIKSEREDKTMTLNEYQTEAMRAASGVSVASEENLLLNGVMGLNGEAGECIDLVKKNIFQGHKLDREHMAKELGDCLWYIAVAAKGIGYSLDDIGEMNKVKLRKRYPEGFEVAKSTDREKGDI